MHFIPILLFSTPGQKLTPDYIKAELPEEGIGTGEDAGLEQRMKYARMMLEQYKGNKEKSRSWAEEMANLQREQMKTAAPAPVKKKKGNWFSRKS